MASIHPQHNLSAPPQDARDVVAMPTVLVAPSELFCHPSRLANTYEPGVERVHQKALFIPGENVVASVRKGRTPPYAQLARLGWRGRLAAWLECRREGGCLDLGERIAYDARPIDNGNMAHLVQHHLANLGYLKDRLGHGLGEVTVILEGRPAELAVRVFDQAGFEVVKTDRAVAANLAEVSAGQFFHLLPYVQCLEIGGWIPDTPKRIFISRRQTRRLANEEEIQARLQARGFEKVYFERLSILEQWSLLRNATQVVAIHGAALGCLAFQATRADGPRAKLVELFGPGFVVNPYRKFMAVLGGRWAGCRGKLTPAVIRDIDRKGLAKAHAFDDFELAPETVEAALEYIGGGEN